MRQKGKILSVGYEREPIMLIKDGEPGEIRVSFWNTSEMIDDFYLPEKYEPRIIQEMVRHGHNQATALCRTLADMEHEPVSS